MKKFSELKVGEEFYSTCSISEKELEEYLKFSRVKNVLLDDPTMKNKLVSGRAILSRMEGEFTRLSKIYGNVLIFIGTDGVLNGTTEVLGFSNHLKLMRF